MLGTRANQYSNGINGNKAREKHKSFNYTKTIAYTILSNECGKKENPFERCINSQLTNAIKV